MTNRYTLDGVKRDKAHETADFPLLVGEDLARRDFATRAEAIAAATTEQPDLLWWKVTSFPAEFPTYEAYWQAAWKDTTLRRKSQVVAKWHAWDK